MNSESDVDECQVLLPKERTPLCIEKVVAQSENGFHQEVSMLLYSANAIKPTSDMLQLKQLA